MATVPVSHSWVVWFLAVFLVGTTLPSVSACDDSDEESSVEPGVRIMVARFEGVTAREKIKVTYKGEERLFDITDRTILLDGDKQENIAIKDLAKYFGKRVGIRHKDGKANVVNFTKLLPGS